MGQALQPALPFPHQGVQSRGLQREVHPCSGGPENPLGAMGNPRTPCFCSLLLLFSQSVMFCSLATLWTVARLLCPGSSPGKHIGVGYHFLLQEIFPTQGWKPGLPHCRQILYQLSHKGSPRKLGVGSLSIPDPGIEPGSPALQMDSLPTELSEKPKAGLVVLNSFSFCLSVKLLIFH